MVNNEGLPLLKDTTRPLRTLEGTKRHLGEPGRTLATLPSGNVRANRE